MPEKPLQPSEEPIAELERAREQGDAQRALELSNHLLYEAAASGDSRKLVEVLQHRLEVYKHAFQATGEPLFLELMRADVETGLRLAAAHEFPDAQATFQLRLGDTLLLRGDAVGSLPAYREAVSLVDPETNPARRAEFLSHLGRARAKAGELEQSKQDLEQSLRLAEAAEGVRPFHKLIIVSGILMRLAEWAKLSGDTGASKGYLDRASVMARELNAEHQMPMRLKQIEQLERELQ